MTCKYLDGQPGRPCRGLLSPEQEWTWNFETPRLPGCGAGAGETSWTSPAQHQSQSWIPPGAAPSGSSLEPSPLRCWPPGHTHTQRQEELIPKKYIFLNTCIWSTLSQQKHNYTKTAAILSGGNFVQAHERQISVLYKALSLHDEGSSNGKRRAWSLDIKEDIAEVERAKACLKAQSQTINTGMKMLQHKRLMRTYITPEILNKCSPDTPDTCLKMLNWEGYADSLCMGAS